jgi:hypothetical protein
MMTDQESSGKATLLLEIEAAWGQLQSTLVRLSEAEVTGLHDQEGWTVKDHLTHLTAWEESVIAFLHGRPRHEGLGVDEATYTNAAFDDINAVIQKQRKDVPLDQALAQLQATHRRLLVLLEPLTDADLAQPLRAFLPNAPADDRRRAIEIVRDNTSAHFSEHLGWIEALVHKDEPV